MLRKTLFFSSLIGAGSSAVGGSIAMKARIWKRCVTTMSRNAPVCSWHDARPAVAAGPGRAVDRPPPPEPELLRHVDLDMVDEVAVPDRLEQPVGEAER